MDGTQTVEKTRKTKKAKTIQAGFRMDAQMDKVITMITNDIRKETGVGVSASMLKRTMLEMGFIAYCEQYGYAADYKQYLDSLENEKEEE